MCCFVTMFLPFYKCSYGFNTFPTGIMSSDEEIKRPKVKKRVVNSDSEDDIEIAQSLEEKLDIPIQQSDESEEVLISKKKFQRVKRTVNSDADSDGNENDALKSPTTNLGKSFAISAPKVQYQ